MRPHTLLLVLLSAMLVGAPGAHAAAKPAKSPKCKSGQVKRTVSKKTTCVAANKFKPVTPKVDRSIAVVDTLTGARLPKVALRNGKTYAGPFSSGERLTIQNAVSVAQERLRTAAIDAATPQLTAVGVSARRATRAAVSSRPVATGTRLADSVTLGQPQVNVTVDQATGSAQVTGKIDGTVKLDNGATGNFEVSVSGTVGGAAGPQGDLTFEVGGTIDEGGKSTSRKVKLTLDQSATKDVCPDATGRIEYIAPYKGSVGGTDVFKAGPVTYGSISTEHSVSSRVNSVVQMRDDATLPKVPFLVSYDVRLAQKVKLLGIPLKNVKATAIATASGTLDAKTGAIDPGMAFNVGVTTSGMSAGNAASLKAELTKQAEQMSRTMLGELAQHMQKVETAAQSGKCTALTLNPASGSQKLGAGDTATVAGHISAPGDGGKDVTAKVSWTASPEAGQATVADPSANPMSMTVTGAQASPDAARVRVKAVSHTGISELSWVAAPKPPFPSSYSGPISFQSHYQNPINLSQQQNSAGQATATYTRTSTKTFGDGTMTALYDLTTLDVSSVTREEINGSCTTTLPPFSPGVWPQTGNSLVIKVSPAGDWTYTAMAYTSFGILQGTRVCSGSTTSQTMVPVFDFATDGPNLGDSRAMAPKGVISGGTPNGIWKPSADATRGATWSLTPVD